MQAAEDVPAVSGDLAIIISGPMISLGATTATGYQDIFAVCAVLTVAARVVVVAAQRVSRRSAQRTAATWAPRPWRKTRASAYSARGKRRPVISSGMIRT